MKTLNKILFFSSCGLLLLQLAFAQIDVVFMPVTDTALSRNQYVNIDVVLRNTEATNVYIQGFEISFDYSATKFAGIPTLTDYVNGSSGDFGVNDVSVADSGKVKYLKAYNSLSKTVPASGDFTAFRLTFKVTNNAAEEATPATFTFDGYYTNDLSDTSANSVAGVFNNTSYNIVADTTPPITYASPASVSDNATINVTLAVNSSSYRDNDLQYIKYTLDGNDPTDASATYSGAIVITANIGEVTLKFMGRDIDDNWESVHTETYTVDNAAPTITAPSITPSLVSKDMTLEVGFTVSEALAASPSVTMPSGKALSFDSLAGLTYTYKRTLDGTEQEGVRNITISNVKDAFDNTASDSSLTTNIDFTPATYKALEIGPTPVVSGNPVYITFNASEKLDYTQTTLNMMGRSDSEFVSEYYDNGTSRWTYVYKTTGNLTGTETTAIFVVHGSDVIGNRSDSNKDWGLITVTGKDTLDNDGIGTKQMNLIFEE